MDDALVVESSCRGIFFFFFFSVYILNRIKKYNLNDIQGRMILG